jgi:hypothetical protein
MVKPELVSDLYAFELHRAGLFFCETNEWLTREIHVLNWVRPSSKAGFKLVLLAETKAELSTV